MRLDQLPRGRAATIDSIDWAALSDGEGRRMRELGFDEGVRIEALHSGPFGRDPLACRVGRMIVAIRRAHAATVTVIEQTH
ncbi:FeoA family protein [Sphingomonas sp. ID0503]|uniref:FeoA family protein n=1 Tax=Sphingomonas sp. ID0503 TaxID=3399691 RepID=UPI003AFA3920